MAKKPSSKKKKSSAAGKSATRVAHRTSSKAKATTARPNKPAVKPAAGGTAATAKPGSKRAAPAVEAKAAAPAKAEKSTSRRRSRAGASGNGQEGRGKHSVAAAASAAAADSQGYVFINGRRVRMISTKGLASAKKSRRADNNDKAAHAQARERKPLKSRLSKQDLQKYRALLLLKRAELVGDLTAMEAEALRSSGGDISHMPIHMADIGTDTFDQDFMLGLAESERKLMREIDDSLRRIEDGTYGVCVMTGKRIPKARLDAKPWAKYTIEAARLHEQGRAM